MFAKTPLLKHRFLWEPGRTAEESRAVYAIAEIRNRLIKIRVSLRSTSMQVNAVFVRARAYIPSDQVARGCNFIVNFFTFGRPNPDDVNVYTLGDVAEQQVNFINGMSDELEFTVAQRGVDYITVGKTTWNWQYRTLSTGSWTTFAQTEHNVYTILSRPIAPWVIGGTDESSRHHLLWTDLLERACWWARGQRTVDGTAAALTEQLFQRGSGSLNLLRYEHTSGNPAFANRRSHRFNLQDFLDAIDPSRTAQTDVIVMTVPAHS